MRPIRIHVATIDQVDVDEGGGWFSDPSVRFHCGRVSRDVSVYFPKEAATQVMVTVEAVRAAAPSLQQASGPPS